MPQSSAHSSERLDELLSWLDDNPVQAADVYLDIRAALIKIFTWNHCSDPEGLTDKVFDRVAAKLPGLKDSFEGDPKLYFYGVANNLIKEYRKAAILHVSLDGVDGPTDPSLAVEEETREMRGDCLDQCLQVLTPEKRALILDYYSREKRDKIIHRAEMARSLGVSIRALRVRMLRIRAGLEECIERCLDQKAKNS
jgi:DNA-directed RNA polymerase specialized sigma24 family protein